MFKILIQFIIDRLFINSIFTNILVNRFYKLLMCYIYVIYGGNKMAIKKRGGRPPRKKTERLNIVLTEQEYLSCQRAAYVLDCSMSEVVRVLPLELDMFV